MIKFVFKIIKKIVAILFVFGLTSVCFFITLSMNTFILSLITGFVVPLSINALISCIMATFIVIPSMNVPLFFDNY